MGLKIQSAAKSKHTHAHAQHQEAISKIGGKLDSKISRPYSNERKKKKTPNLIRGIGVEDGGKGVEEVGREGEIAGEESSGVAGEVGAVEVGGHWGRPTREDNVSALYSKKHKKPNSKLRVKGWVKPRGLVLYYLLSFLSFFLSFFIYYKL